MKTQIEMKIGELASALGVKVETIKFYEKKGIIPRPPKPAQGFRSYPSEYVDKISFIRRAQDLGFTLKEIKALLSLKLEDKDACGKVMKKASEKLNEIELKIRDLQKIKKSLKRIQNCCDSGSPTLSECPILDCF